MIDKALAVLRSEIGPFSWRLALSQAVAAPLPPLVGSRLRVTLLRRAGFEIGHGTLMYGMPTFVGDTTLARQLQIGSFCLFNVGCTFDLSASVTIGERVGVGHQVLFLTASHRIGPKTQRAGELTSAPIVVENGVWIGARCVILPGVTIGSGSVISAGLVVSRDVPPDTLLSGSQSVSLSRWR